MATLNTIIDAFDTFCSDHLQINTFYSDQTWNFQTANNIYPAVILIPSPSSIADGMITYVFTLFVIDRLNKDRSNLNDVLSDTSLIMADIVSEFNDNYDTYDFQLSEGDVGMEPLFEVFDDVVAGWVSSSLSIETRFSRNDCIIPKIN